MKLMNKTLLLVTLLLLVAAPIKSAEDYWDPSSDSESELIDETRNWIGVDAYLILPEDDTLDNLESIVVTLDDIHKQTVKDLINEINNDPDLKGYSLVKLTVGDGDINYIDKPDTNLASILFESGEKQDVKATFIEADGYYIKGD